VKAGAYVVQVNLVFHRRLLLAFDRVVLDIVLGAGKLGCRE
jgi:hypothetical protein